MEAASTLWRRVTAARFAVRGTDSESSSRVSPDIAEREGSFPKGLRAESIFEENTAEANSPAAIPAVASLIDGTCPVFFINRKTSQQGDFFS